MSTAAEVPKNTKKNVRGNAVGRLTVHEFVEMFWFEMGFIGFVLICVCHYYDGRVFSSFVKYLGSSGKNSNFLLCQLTRNASCHLV